MGLLLVVVIEQTSLVSSPQNASSVERLRQFRIKDRLLLNRQFLSTSGAVQFLMGDCHELE